MFDVYMSPGSVTERAALLRRALHRRPIGRGAGGGLAEEGEDIEVLELDFDEALAMIARRAHRRRQDDHAAAVGRARRAVRRADAMTGSRRYVRSWK